MSIVLARKHAGRFQNFSWSQALRQWPRRRGGPGGAASRPLLTGFESQTEEVAEEIGEAGQENGSGYGATDNPRSGSRFQPPGLHPERNEHQDD